MSQKLQQTKVEEVGTPHYLISSLALALPVTGFSLFINQSEISLNMSLMVQIILVLALSFFWRRMHRRQLKILSAILLSISLWLSMASSTLVALGMIKGSVQLQFTAGISILTIIGGMLAASSWLFDDAKLAKQPFTILSTIGGLFVLVGLGYGWKSQNSGQNHNISLAAKNPHESTSHEPPTHHAEKANPSKHESKNEIHWSYSGDTGPKYWGDLKSEFQECGQGQEQSPIDINRASQSTASVQFKYKSSTINAVDNGHTLQFNFDKGSQAVINGRAFGLKQFHFHAPSEHTLNGIKYPLELHFVHQNESGQLAVIGVFIEKGEANPVINQLLPFFPELGSREKQRSSERFTANGLLPKIRKVYQYPGSLTTPPCSEGVFWNVMTTTLTMSDEQIQSFIERYDNNSRPVQPQFSRNIGDMPQEKAYHH